MAGPSERRLPDGRIVYDPRGTVTADPLPPAPRPAALDGLRLGVLDNTKWNASKLLRQVVATKLNLEMAATPEMIDIAVRVKPHQATLVPEQPEELTTTGGLDVVSHAAALRIVVRSLRTAGIGTSVFIDADPAQVQGAAEVGAEAVEINTGPYADAAENARAEHRDQVAAAAEAAAEQGLDVLAGHGLTYQNVGPIAAIPTIAELNIGHSIVARAVLVGMERAVREMLALLRA